MEPSSRTVSRRSPPNGRYFVYSRGGGPTGADLYRRNIDGSNPVQLTAAPLNDIAADYSPDGKRLVFHSNRGGLEDADIYTMKATVEGPDNSAVNLTDSLRWKDDDTKASQERAPSFSPDGQHIAFWWFTEPAIGYRAGFTDGEIYTMRADGSQAATSPRQPHRSRSERRRHPTRLGTQPHRGRRLISSHTSGRPNP